MSVVQIVWKLCAVNLLANPSAIRHELQNQILGDASDHGTTVRQKQPNYLLLPVVVYYAIIEKHKKL